MTLIEKIREDRISAMKARESVRKNLLGCLIADSTKINKEPADDFVLSIIKKFIDNANFVIEKTDKDRPEVAQAKEEICILDSYRPQQLSEMDIRGEMSELKDNGKADMKSIMAYFKEKFPGQYDGKLVSTIAKEFI